MRSKKTNEPYKLKLRYVRDYMACVSQLDQHFGLVMDTLEELGLTKDSIVVFVSDHSYMLGEHDYVGKNVIYDGALNVPTIIRIPGNFPHLILHSLALSLLILILFPW